MGGGGHKIPYPKHVWSPAGGWYAQPANWKRNTAVMSLVAMGIIAVTWTISADREHYTRMPPRDAFFPSRWYAREIIEHERREDAKIAAAKGNGSAAS